MKFAPSLPSRWPRNEPRTRSRTSSTRSRKRNFCRSPTNMRRRLMPSRRPRRKTRSRPPTFRCRPTLKELARQEGLSFDRPKLLSREAAEHLGPGSSAEAGITPLSGGRKFAEEFFDSQEGNVRTRGTDRSRPYPIPRGRKRRCPSACSTARGGRLPDVEGCLQDDPGRENWPQWPELAEQFKKTGTIKETSVDGYRVLTSPPTKRRQSRIVPTQFFISETVEDAPIADIANAGDAFRDAFFGLQVGAIAIAPNQPRTINYLMALEKREPATFTALYAPYGNFKRRYESSAQEEVWAAILADEMDELAAEERRSPKGLGPPDEVKG